MTSIEKEKPVHKYNYISKFGKGICKLSRKSAIRMIAECCIKSAMQSIEYIISTDSQRLLEGCCLILHDSMADPDRLFPTFRTSSKAAWANEVGEEWKSGRPKPNP